MRTLGDETRHGLRAGEIEGAESGVGVMDSAHVWLLPAGTHVAPAAALTATGVSVAELAAAVGAPALDRVVAETRAGVELARHDQHRVRG